MNQPVLGVRGTAEYVKATGEGTAESPYIPTVQIEGGLNLTVSNASLEIANDTGGPIPISAANLPLPSGAATGALQTTGNTSLANIDTKIPALGQALAAACTPVVLPVAQITALTPPTSVTINNPLTLAAESGYPMYRNPALTNTAVQVKASGGSVMGWNFINPNSVDVYVNFFNLASNVTVGTSPVLFKQFVPARGVNFLEVGLIPQEVFSVGISIACVTGLADNSNTAPVTPIHASVRYK